MSANTTYYAKIPKIIYEWVEISALTSKDVLDKYPNALEVLHWTEYEELQQE